MFTCGCNKHGEVGQPKSQESFPLFTEIRFEKAAEMALEPKPVVDMECGWWHTLILTKAFPVLNS